MFNYYTKLPVEELQIEAVEEPFVPKKYKVKDIWKQHCWMGIG